MEYNIRVYKPELKQEEGKINNRSDEWSGLWPQTGKTDLFPSERLIYNSLPKMEMPE